MRALLALTAASALVATGLATAAAPAEAFETHRIEGADRYATAVEIDRAMDAVGGPVFLANGQKFPDALAAGPVVAAEGGHLLLTAPDALPAVVAARIQELAPSEIVVVGSSASVSDAVAQHAADAARRGGADAELARIGGADRVETSLLLLDRLLESGPVTHLWVASGATFPDALVAASVAGRHHHAVVLDHHGPSAEAARAWLDAVGSRVMGRHVQVAGGPSSVSDADADGLWSFGTRSVDRIAGRDRYETARMINDAWGASSTPEMLLATGENFPDALAGAALAAASGAPMYLTPNGCHAAITPTLRAEASRLGVQAVVGLGSAATVSDGALRLGPCATTLQQQIGQVYGTFATQRHTGRGSRVIDLGREIPYAQVVAQLSSSSFTGIHALDRDQQHVDSIAWGHRTYSGTSLVMPHGSAVARYLRVESDGAWTIEVRDLTSAPVLQGATSGGSDAVLLYAGPAAPVSSTNGGSGRAFSAQELHGYWQYALPFGLDARTSGTLHQGPSVIGIRATQPWTLRVG
ncbi:cell wall-binding repeat-containing protein [Agrococcus sp. DT81.2]|uniref:cell wall-binding repeat-containing protein n=1 Tax=Agrococcus sp. DT81.2 TaxID=3393414 RepID=UPI003CE51014